MRVRTHTKSQIFKVFHGVSLDTQQSHLLAVVGCLYSNTVSKHFEETGSDCQFLREGTVSRNTHKSIGRMIVSAFPCVAFQP